MLRVGKERTIFVAWKKGFFYNCIMGATSASHSSAFLLITEKEFHRKHLGKRLDFMYNESCALIQSEFLSLWHTCILSKFDNRINAANCFGIWGRLMGIRRKL